MRMEVQVGEVTAQNPQQMVGWAAATWEECMRGLFRFYPDEVVAATVVAEARGLVRLWYLPHKEFVVAFYNKCLATWSQKPEEFTKLTCMQQFVRGLLPFLNPELCVLGTVQYAGEEHEGLRWRVENDITITTTAEA